MTDGTLIGDDSVADDSSDGKGQMEPESPNYQIEFRERTSAPTLNVLSLVAMGFFWVSGGMYGNEELLSVAAPGYALPALLIVPLIYSLPISLMNSELASALPLEGGSVAWVSEALGSAIGGHNAYWTWFAYCMDSSLYPRFASAYLAKQLNVGFVMECILAMVIVVLVTVNKLFGLRSVATLSLALSAISVLPSFFLVGLGLPKIDWTQIHNVSGPKTSWSELVTWALWLYSGALSLGSVAKDVKNAGRTYLVSASILYVLDVLIINFIPLIISLSLDHDRENYEAGHFIKIGNQLAGGQWLGVLLTIGSQVSLIGLYQSGSVASDQYLAHLLHEHVIPVISPSGPKLAQVATPVLAEKFSFRDWMLGVKGDAGVPRIMTLINASIALLLCWLSISDTLTVSILLSSLSICLMVLAFLVLKFKQPHLPRGYAVPGGRWGAVCISLPVIILSLVNLALGLSDMSILMFKVIPVRSASFCLVVVVGVAVHVIGYRMENSPRKSRRESQLERLVGHQAQVYGSTT